MFIPQIGRLVKKRGNTAQCMAQAKLVPIPRASQLILNDIPQNYYIATMLQKLQVRDFTA